MALDPAQFLNLLRELVDKNPRTREEHADAVTDLRAAMSPAESHALASVLAALAVWEPDGTVREAQLHALAELHEWDQSTPDALNLLQRLDRATLAGPEIEYVGYLLGE